MSALFIVDVCMIWLLAIGIWLLAIVYLQKPMANSQQPKYKTQLL